MTKATKGSGAKGTGTKGGGGGSKKGKDPYSSGGRGVSVRVKSARGRTPSSTRWLTRQLNDPYVALSKKEGYRSRAIYKLKEIDEKIRLFKNGDHVVDLGAAPGSWSQYAVSKIGTHGRLVGVDLSEIEPLPGALFLQGDFLTDETLEAVLAALKGKADVVMSDMAAASTGHHQTDHIRIILLCEVAIDFAVQVLKPGGVFVAKVLQGGTESGLLALLKKHFAVVKHIKPKASRQDSTEMYVVATGFRHLSKQED